MNEEQEQMIKRVFEEVIGICEGYLESRKYANPSDIKLFIDDLRNSATNMEVISNAEILNEGLVIKTDLIAYSEDYNNTYEKEEMMGNPDASINDVVAPLTTDVEENKLSCGCDVPCYSGQKSCDCLCHKESELK